MHHFIFALIYCFLTLQLIKSQVGNVEENSLLNHPRRPAMLHIPEPLENRPLTSPYKGISPFSDVDYPEVDDQAIDDVLPPKYLVDMDSIKAFRPKESFQPETSTLDVEEVMDQGHITSFAASTKKVQSPPWRNKKRLPTLLPDMQDKKSIIELLKMAHNSYFPEEKQESWLDNSPWRSLRSFNRGMMGMRGHLFTNKDESKIVFAIKGTTPIISSSHENCCCAQQVCDCAQKSKASLWNLFQNENKPTCSEGCIQKKLLDDEGNYQIALKNLDVVRHYYPLAQIWLVGHSLGGAIASALSVTTTFEDKYTSIIPAFVFNSPGERLLIKRLGYPVVEEDLVNVFHFANNLDPIFSGNLPSYHKWTTYHLDTRSHVGFICLITKDMLDPSKLAAFMNKDKKWDTERLRHHKTGVNIDEWFANAIEMPKCIPAQPVENECANWKFV